MDLKFHGLVLGVCFLQTRLVEIRAIPDLVYGRAE